MRRDEFEALCRYAGIAPPEGVEPYVEGMDETGGKALMPRAFLLETLAANAVPPDKAAALASALDEIEADEKLLRLSLALGRDAQPALNRCAACEFEAQEPACLSGFARQAYAFLYALSCVAHGRGLLRARGVPPEYDRDIPERMIRRQLAKYVQTGDIRFDDYPWDMNFYCCAIFLFDRFYFIPYRHEAPAAYRRASDGKVLALWPEGARVRRDGQLDGVNGVTDARVFTTIWREDDASVTANPVDPKGLILPEPVTLDKRLWRRALADGDYLLALHIPGGEGYTPQRVRSSMALALAFYDRYFPEIPVKGFWSESWLYDPGLRALLPPDSRIVSVQRQFYCYPTPEGDRMHRLEVFGDENADPAAVKAPSRLQRALADAWARGERFHTTGMFVLREEASLMGQSPYQPKEG